jgi:hypothetical protein
MPTKAHKSLDLPLELMQQYKDAWLRASDDLRLVILLAFNAFEEVMKAYAAWRLSCGLEALPATLKNNSGLLFDVVLTADKDARPLREQARKLSELRNDVAHGFHKRTYKGKLAEFVLTVSGEACPRYETKRREAFIEAVSTLALNIAVHINDNVNERAEFPVPVLSLELGDLARK